MAMDIFVGVMCVIAAAAGIWVWWREHGSDPEQDYMVLIK